MGSAFVDINQADPSNKVPFVLRDVFSWNLHVHGSVILDHTKGSPWAEYLDDNLAISIPLLWLLVLMVFTNKN